MTGDRRSSTVAFVVVCSIAGALAVPLHAVATPASALAAGLLGLVGLRLWRWSRLPGGMKAGADDGSARVVRPAMSLALGMVVGLILLGVIRLVIEPAAPGAGARIAAAGAQPIWRRLVTIYVAAVGEELVFRLLLLSVVTGLIVRFHRRDPAPNPVMVWIAIALSALAFAASHLPAWSAVGTLNASLSLMVLGLNGLGGLVFGHVFVRYGIAAAIWAHAGADCIIQLVGPLTG